MRNVLIVSYYFPPFNSIASIRVSQFAYWLSKLGWNAVILTVDYRKPAEDPLDQLVDDASIIRIDGNDPFEMLRSIIKRFMAKPGPKKDPNIQGTIEEAVENKKIKWLRKLNPVSNVRWPDNAIWWQNKAVKTGLVYLAKHPEAACDIRFDVIAISGRGADRQINHIENAFWVEET